MVLPELNRHKPARPGNGVNVSAWIRAGLVLILACAATVSQAANIYRYVDENGRTVYNSLVPPEYVKNGYTILNERGQVVEIIAPALNSDQLQAQEAVKREQEQEEIRLRRQIEADNQLLRLYRSPQEVASKRDERVRQLDSQIAALNINISKVNQDIAEIDQRIALAKERNMEPAANTTEELVFKNAEKSRFESQLLKLEVDKLNLISQAEEDMTRLRDLLGLTEEPATE